MNILTYLGFTLVSVLIQFCVMDFVHVRNQQDSIMDLNVSSQRKTLNEDIKKYNALYYRKNVNNEVNTLMNIVQKNNIDYDNASITDTSYITSTDSSSSILDVLYYEEKVSTTENINVSTEPTITTTDYDNTTEITLFASNNITKLDTVPPSTLHRNNENCDCNLFFNQCDINCCCDNDCSKDDFNIFFNCNETAKGSHKLHLCPLQTFYMGDYNVGSNSDSVNSFESLFCVINTNIPKKQKVTQKYDTTLVNIIRDNSYHWDTSIKTNIQEFVKKPYTYGDYLWLLKNGSIYYIDVASPQINNYCTGRAPVRFLKEKNIKCNVKLNDLEMIRILEATHDSQIITATHNMNSSSLNCTTLHCTNWTVLACDGDLCVEYNKSVHEPSCTDHFCTNLALKIEYVFNYFNNTIMNATIKFYIETMSIASNFMPQEIYIRFVLGNNSLNNIIRLSGNPGYIHDLPVVASYAEGNHSAMFFNSSEGTNYLRRPNNENGLCKLNKLNNDYIKFGSNVRTHCKIMVKLQLSSTNDTCKVLQQLVNEYLGLADINVFVSPYGNPHNVKDEEWIPITVENSGLKDYQYKEYNEKSKKLHCYNLITRISLIFTYADVSTSEKRKYKILTTKMEVFARNLTFDNDNMSIVLTVDTNFIDVSNHHIYEYAGPPHLNIYLPTDFFSPFSYNDSFISCSNVLLLLTCLILIISK